MYREVEIIMDRVQNFIVYKKQTGEFVAFYNNIDVMRAVISEDASLTFNKISQDVINELLATSFTVDVDKIISENKKNTIYEITRDFIRITPTKVVEDDVAFENYKRSLISELTDMRYRYISYGLTIDIDGHPVNFKFDGDHQYRMQELLSNYASDAVVYYAPADGSETRFKISDIKRAYIDLFNMKTYIHTYVEVFTEWIHIYLTMDMYKSKEAIYTFGYINDYILEEVNGRYEQQKLLQR